MKTKVFKIEVSTADNGVIRTNIPDTSTEFNLLELYLIYKHIEHILNEAGFDWTIQSKFNGIKEEEKNE